MTAPSGAVENKKAGVFDDFVDVFVSPAKVFERRQDGKFGTHLLILTLAVVVLYYVFRHAMEPIMDAEFARGSAEMLKKNPNMSTDQLDTARKMTGVFGGIIFGVVFPIVTMITGLFLWLAGKLFGSVATAKQALTVATIASIPILLGQIVGAIQAMLISADKLTSQYSVSLSVARFFDPDSASPVLLAVLGRLDLFGIWILVLMGIGLGVMGKLARPKAIAAAVIAWLLGLLPILIPLLMRG